MDRRTLIAIGLGILFFIGWQKFYIEPKYGKQHAAPAQTQSVTATAPGTAQTVLPGAAPTAATSAPVEAKNYPLALDGAIAHVSNGGRFFSDWTIEGYRESMLKGAKGVSLKRVLHSDAGQGELAFDAPEYAYLNKVAGQVVASGEALTWTYEDQNVRLVREFTKVPGQKHLSLKLSGEFKSRPPKFLYVSVAGAGHEDDPEKQDRQLLYHAGKDLSRLMINDLDPAESFPGPVNWIGTQSRYFLMALVPETKAPTGLAQAITENSGRFNLVYPMTSTKFEIPMKVYFGPKEITALKSVDPTLDLTIDLGFFTPIAYGILWFLKWLYTFVKNWGIAIIILTVVIKLLTYPLTYKSMKSMKRMAALQPKMNALREKYKDDKEALNRELMTFMRTQGYNPISGCLPILIQMPVFFALWRVLYSSIELYQAPFFGWIQDLSVKDPYYVTPILLMGFMYLQQRMTPSTATDPMQAKMMQWMPVIFGFMMLNLPAGLTIYMLTNAIASIVQQMILNRKFANEGKIEVLPAEV